MGAPRSFRTLFSISFLLLKPHFPRIISVLDRALSIIISQNSFGTRSLQGPSKPSRSSYQTLAPAEGGPGHPKEQGWDKGQATDPKSIPLHQRGPSQPCPALPLHPHPGTPSTSRARLLGIFPTPKCREALLEQQLRAQLMGCPSHHILGTETALTHSRDLSPGL